MSYKVVYNNTFGGFGISEKGLIEYNKRTLKNIAYIDEVERDDPILIELVGTMGKSINDNYSKLKIKEFPMKYKDFLEWHEYDGNESVNVDYTKYLIHNIKLVKDDISMTSDEKIKKIGELYNEYESRPKNYIEKLQDNNQ